MPVRSAGGFRPEFFRHAAMAEDGACAAGSRVLHFLVETMMHDVPVIRTLCHPETDHTGWHADAVAFHRYWLKISPAGRLPGRQHFDPLELGTMLPRVSLYDVLSPQLYRCRVFSTRSVRVLGRDVTGQRLDEAFVRSPARDVWFADLDEVVASRLPLYRKRRSKLRPELETLMAEEISIPLARDGVAVDMVASFVLWSLDLSGRVL